jgi:hypothetical protein
MNSHGLENFTEDWFKKQGFSGFLFCFTRGTDDGRVRVLTASQRKKPKGIV